MSPCCPIADPVFQEIGVPGGLGVSSQTVMIPSLQRPPVEQSMYFSILSRIASTAAQDVPISVSRKTQGSGFKVVPWARYLSKDSREIFLPFQ